MKVDSLALTNSSGTSTALSLSCMPLTPLQYSGKSSRQALFRLPRQEPLTSS